MIYGFGDRPPEGNLTFKAFSDEAFLKDLASCRYVLCNGGHSTISEALYYGKPVFCAPVGLFYEQTVNAHLLSAAGYGDYCAGPSEWEWRLSRFESRLDEYAARIRDRDFWGNKAVAECLHESHARRKTVIHSIIGSVIGQVRSLTQKSETGTFRVRDRGVLVTGSDWFHYSLRFEGVCFSRNTSGTSQIKGVLSNPWSC